MLRFSRWELFRQKMNLVSDVLDVHLQPRLTAAIVIRVAAAASHRNNASHAVKENHISAEGPGAWERIASSRRVIVPRPTFSLTQCPLQILKNGKGKRAHGIGAALPWATYELCRTAATAAAARFLPPSAAWALPAAPRLPRRRWVSAFRIKTRTDEKSFDDRIKKGAYSGILYSFFLTECHVSVFFFFSSTPISSRPGCSRQHRWGCLWAWLCI